MVGILKSINKLKEKKTIFDLNKIHTEKINCMLNYKLCYSVLNKKRFEQCINPEK